MNAIRVHKRIESETIHLPELRPMIGRTVEIIVLEESRRPATKRSGRSFLPRPEPISSTQPSTGTIASSMSSTASRPPYDPRGHERRCRIPPDRQKLRRILR